MTRFNRFRDRLNQAVNTANTVREVVSDIRTTQTSTTSPADEVQPENPDQMDSAPGQHVQADPASGAIKEKISARCDHLLASIDALGLPGLTSETIKSHPEAYQHARFFSVELDETNPRDVKKRAKDLAYHVIVNTDFPIADGEPIDAQSVDFEGSLLEYAKGFGITKIDFDGSKDDGIVFVGTVGYDLVKFGEMPADTTMSQGEWVRHLGQALNRSLTGVEKLMPHLISPDLNAQGFTLANAQAAAQLNAIADFPEDVARVRLRNLGFDMSTFSWLKSDEGIARGYLIADQDGNVHGSFRGTDHGSLADWVANAETGLSDPSWDNDDVKLHAGFAEIADADWEDFKAAIEKATGDNPDAQFLLAGHSLGAALVQLYAMRGHREGLFPSAENLQLYTLGSPRTGNPEFAAAMNETFQHNYRIVRATGNEPDPVALLPVAEQGFKHAGQEVVLDARSIDQNRRVTFASSSEPSAASFALNFVEGLVTGDDEPRNFDLHRAHNYYRSLNHAMLDTYAKE